MHERRPNSDPADGEGGGEPALGAVAAPHHTAGGRASAAILTLEKDLEREHERTTESLDEMQRRLEEAEARVAESGTITEVRGDAPAETRPGPEETDRALESAIRGIEAEAERRMRAEAERRLAEQAERLRAEAVKRAEKASAAAEERHRAELDELRGELDSARSTSRKLTEEAVRRAELAEARAMEAEKLVKDAEVLARKAAADWLRGQGETIRRDAEQRAERAARDAHREADAKAEELVAEREVELASELEQVAEALRIAELRLRELEEREPLRELEEQIAPAGETPRRGLFARFVRSRGPEETPQAQPRRSQTRRFAPDETRAPMDLASLNEAGFEQLRAMGMSVTQATRVIAYRERQNGFDSVDDLDAVPGFPRERLTELKERLSA